jgi:plasmid stability protein
MATVTIDDRVYEKLKDRARGNHRSVEAEVRELLEAQIGGEPLQSKADRELSAEQVAKMRATIADLFAFRDQMAAKYGSGRTDSVAMIRAIRDEE